MTRYGAWQARVDETRALVKSIEKNYDDYTRHILDSAQIADFDTEYPYWHKIHIYTKDGYLVRAKLYTNPDKGAKTEELYFKDGELVYGIMEPSGIDKTKSGTLEKGDEYFFTRQTLVLALDADGNRKDLEDNTVTISGIDLQKEAGQIKKLATKLKDDTL